MHLVACCSVSSESMYLSVADTFNSFAEICNMTFKRVSGSSIRNSALACRSVSLFLIICVRSLGVSFKIRSLFNNTAFYLVRRYSGELKWDSESKEMKFFSLDDLPTNLHDADLIEEYKKYVKRKKMN